jgi:YD repeat-containing protein
VLTPNGGVSSLGYDDSGLLSSIVEPGNRTLTLKHDGSGNLTGRKKGSKKGVGSRRSCYSALSEKTQ